MFKTKPTWIGNRSEDLLWVASDQGCYDYIIHDWKEYFHHIAKWINDTRVVVQAGGNCGLYPLYYAEIFERVFTFEPDPLNFHCLAANCKNSKIIKFNTALTDNPQYLRIGNPDPLNNGMPCINGGDTVVYGITIDSLDLPVVSLIHLDVETYEYEVIQGAVRTIERCRPLVVLEITRAHQEINQLMKSLNYRIVTEYGDPPNFVYVPIERIPT